MYLSELIKKDKKELNKLSKTEIIETIINSKWQWESNENKTKEAEKKLVIQSEGENAAKTLLLGYLGERMPENEYGELPMSKVNLLELIGKMMVKASRYE